MLRIALGPNVSEIPLLSFIRVQNWGFGKLPFVFAVRGVWLYYVRCGGCVRWLAIASISLPS